VTDSAQTVQLLHQVVDLLVAILAAVQEGAAQSNSDLTSAVKAAGDAAITYKLLFPH
jgi:t-SNARE complex subunit (syntaxin)